MINVIPYNPFTANKTSADDARLVKAAVRHGCQVYTGWRHSLILRHMTGLDISATQHDHGFVDQYGMFYDRYLAARIAKRAHQIARLPIMLTSEDLWDDDGTAREPGKPYNPMGDRQAAIDRAAEWRDRARR